jgi:hypothetical protein
MRRRVLARLGGSSAASALILGGGWLLTAAPAPAAPTTETFEFTGEAQEFVVPENVCQVTVDAHGAAAETGTRPIRPDSGPRGPRHGRAHRDAGRDPPGLRGRSG